MRLVIFNQCPDPRDMFTNEDLYTESMLQDSGKRRNVQ